MLIGLVVSLALGGLVLWAFVEAVQAEPAIVGSIGTAVLGVFGVLWQQRRSENARLRAVHRVRMTPLYEGLLDMVAQNDFGPDEEPDTDTVKFMRDLKMKQLILGASTEMVRAFNEWQASTAAAQAKDDKRAAIYAWEDLLRAIRKDFGHDDLEPGELLGVFIADYDEQIAGA